MQRNRQVFGAVCPNKMGKSRGATEDKKGKVIMPRSSSPVAVFMDKAPCIVEQAFATIAWDDLEDCTSVMRRESDSLGSQVIESDGDDDFGEYVLDFMEDSSTGLESSLSPIGLVPFQGCIIPPLTPQRDFSRDEGPGQPSLDASIPPAQDGAFCEATEPHEGRVLGDAVQDNTQLHRTLHRKQEEIDSLQERNVHLRELASHAKHLASVLDKLMTVRAPSLNEPARPSCDQISFSPCKRRRPNEESETTCSASVEDILRDISTRCNAVLREGANDHGPRPALESIRMYGAFSGLQTSISMGGSECMEGTETGEGDSSFRTSVREHSTIRTQVFLHGHAFTSRTPQGGYRFRWVPNHS